MILRILSVDDQIRWRKAIEMSLFSAKNVRVKTVNDFGEAEKLLQKEFYHLILVDLNMDLREDDNLDGLKFLEKLAQSGINFKGITFRGDSPPIGVVILSGRGTSKIVHDTFKDFGIVDFLDKKDNFSLTNFAETIFERATKRYLRNIETEFEWDIEETFLDSLRDESGLILLKDEIEEIIRRLCEKGSHSVKITDSQIEDDLVHLSVCIFADDEQDDTQATKTQIILEIIELQDHGEASDKLNRWMEATGHETTAFRRALTLHLRGIMKP